MSCRSSLIDNISEIAIVGTISHILEGYGIWLAGGKFMTQRNRPIGTQVLNYFICCNNGVLKGEKSPPPTLLLFVVVAG